MPISHFIYFCSEKETLVFLVKKYQFKLLFMKKHIFIFFFGALFLGGYAQVFPVTDSNPWELTGNAGTTSSNFIGTTDNQPLIFKTNNTEHVRILSDGNVGIGTNTPTGKLHIKEGSLVISREIFTPPSPIDNLLAFRIDDGRSGVPIHTWKFDNLIGNEYGLHISLTPHTYTTPLHSYLFLGTNGLIGVGNKNPKSKLDITGGIRADAATIAGPLSARKLTVDSVFVNGNTTSYGDTYLNGNVGIGTNVPQARLDVNGSFRAQSASITGDITVENIIVRGRLSIQHLALQSIKILNNSFLMGNVGIGTEQPQQKLHISGGNVLISKTTYRAPSGHDGSILFGGPRHDDFPNGIWGIGYDGFSGLQFFRPYNLGGGEFFNCYLFLHNGGNVGIGTCLPQAKLDVNGSLRAQSATLTGAINALSANINGLIRTKEINVTLAGWSDFIFDKNYELMPLSEVEEFITENHHLPNVPSAAEVEVNGVNIGEMNAILLQKIEELTLYIIQLEKRLSEVETKKKTNDDY